MIKTYNTNAILQSKDGEFCRAEEVESLLKNVLLSLAYSMSVRGDTFTCTDDELERPESSVEDTLLKLLEVVEPAALDCTDEHTGLYLTDKLRELGAKPIEEIA